MKVDLERLREAREIVDAAPHFFCKECGETDPEGGFYPLSSSGWPSDLSFYTCNPCMDRWRKEQEES